jgi:two-component system alkaline phosphatase synthesis response regulator PhoP
VNGLRDSAPFPEARVLVVDDEAEVRSVLARLLDLLGYSADEAASGQQALEMLRRAPYDVLVLDIRMPGMDGVEVMERARQTYPGLPVVFLTGYATLESAVAAVKAHAADYLFKPAGIHELADAVASALRERTHGRRPRALIDQDEDEDEDERFVRAGPVTLDRQRRLAIVAETEAGSSLKATLTASETALLAYLMRRPGIVSSPSELARLALGYQVSDAEASDVIRPHVSHLRKKIEPDPDHPRLLRTVRGKGYSFTPD